jgi:progesterone-induced-blocking factor 1
MSLGNLKPNDNNIFTSTLHSVPTSSKRRIQQALGLAQRLQAKQREYEETLSLLQKRERELENCQD